MGAFRIGRIAGIDIRIHWSWFAIFLLLTWWLAHGFFHEVYDDWTLTQEWAAAVITTILFFSSILLHELSHSLMAKRLGLPVTSITLFIFGGVSALGAEPSSARQEFQVAIVGPLTSFLLGGLFGLLALIAWRYDYSGRPPAAIAEYLAIINVAVGVFNMLPGFPLDGGRVLRSALWARSQSMLRATRWAATAGTVISFGLIAAGVVSVLAGSFIGGVWFIVIGWFLRNAAETSYQQLLLRQALEGAKVGAMVNRNFHGAPPDLSLERLVHDHILGQSQRCVPIVVTDDLLGLVTMSDLKRVPPGEWSSTSAFSAMTPREKLYTVSAQDDLTQALEMMATHDIHQLPVMEGRTFLGFVTRADVLRLIQIRTEVGAVGRTS
ncbi:MAG: site-2 protease family protein [Dehalococcoidia bacterium]|nr:site-2 protease family protein [Dehalococcoidia bacterium]